VESSRVILASREFRASKARLVQQGQRDQRDQKVRKGQRDQPVQQDRQDQPVQRGLPLWF